MLRIIKSIFYFYIIFVFQSNVIAKSDIKEEANLRIVSSFLHQQEKDSIMIKEYLVAEKLFEKEEYSESLKLTLSILKKNNGSDNELEYLCNFLIGQIFRKRNDHSKALNYFKTSLKYLPLESIVNDYKLKDFNSKLKKEEFLANTYLRIGTEYYMLSEKDSAAHYFKKILEISTLDNLSKAKSSAYSNLSGVYMGKSNDLAKEYALKAIKLHHENNDKLSESSAINNYANIFLKEEKYEKAKELYSRAISLIENEKSVKAIKNKEDLYYNLAYTMFMQKDYLAYKYLKQSVTFKDTLTSREIRRIVKGVYAEYQEQYKVETLKNKARLEEAQERKTNWFFGILSFLVLVSSGVILYNYKLRQNNLKLKLDQTQLAQKSKLEKLKSESQVRILNATLDGKEAERKQIAETLHDSVSSLLSSANLHLQATRMQFNGDSPIEIDKTQKIILEASQTIRDLSHTLVSSVLLKFGLKYAIKDMAEKYSNSKIAIETDIENVRRYHQGFEIKVNNIIQEFVNNILKHSNASKALVKIKDNAGKLIIHIEDNGDGFDKKEIPKKDGLGINQIDARIQMMKGDFHIDSSSEKGTKIAIVLPIQEKDISIRV